MPLPGVPAVAPGGPGVAVRVVAVAGVCGAGVGGGSGVGGAVVKTLSLGWLFVRLAYEALRYRWLQRKAAREFARAIDHSMRGGSWK